MQEKLESHLLSRDFSNTGIKEATIDVEKSLLNLT
jgi:hypothetical protein